MTHFLVAARILCSLAGAALALGACTTVLAQDALTLDEALAIAMQRSQQLFAEDAAAAAARELAVAARQAPDPTLTAGIVNLPVNGPDEFSLTRDFMTMRSLGLMRELTSRDKRTTRAARFEREAEAAEAGRALAAANLQRGTATAWLDRYYRERMHEVLAAQRDQAALQIEAADLAYRSGLGAQSDVFAARASAAAIEDRIAAAQRDVDVATTRLARWIGAAADRSLAAPPPMDRVPFALGDLESQLAHHPQLALMQKEEDVARAEADIARANKRSDWTVEVMYSQRGPGFADMMSLNVSKPLQWHERNRQDRALAASLAVAEQLRAQREEETRAHLADARSLFQSWQANRARLDRRTASLIPLAAERTVAATAAYRAGKGTLGGVLEARVGEIDARLDYFELAMETDALWAELNYLLAAHDTAEAGRNP